MYIFFSFKINWFEYHFTINFNIFNVSFGASNSQFINFGFKIIVRVSIYNKK